MPVTVKDDSCGLLSAFKSTTTFVKEDTNSNLQRPLQSNKGNITCSMCAQSTTMKHCNGQSEPVTINNHCSENIRDVNSINNGGITYSTQLTF